MAGFLQRMVQRGLGRTRSVQPLYSARYARDGAPAAIPMTENFASERNAPAIRRQAASATEEERDDLNRQAEDEAPEREEESSSDTGVARSPAAEAAQEDEGTLMQQKPLSSIRRRPATTDLLRQADQDSDEEAGQAAGAGDGGGDPGGSDAGLADEAGTQTGVPEDEDIAPGRDSDTLLPKLQRREIPVAESPTRGPRVMRQSEPDEEPAGDAAANQNEDDTVQTSREPETIARRSAPAAAFSPAPLPVPGPTRNQIRDAGDRSAVREGGDFSEAAPADSADLLMPPAAESGFPDRGVSNAQAPGEAPPMESDFPRNDRTAGAPRAVDDHRAGIAGRNPAAHRSSSDYSRNSGRAEASAGPEIQISIGRIEIRAVGDAPASEPQVVYQSEAAAPGQMQSLEEYLKRRNGDAQ